jgi:hypothetical protein
MLFICPCLMLLFLYICLTLLVLFHSLFDVVIFFAPCLKFFLLCFCLTLLLFYPYSTLLFFRSLFDIIVPSFLVWCYYTFVFVRLCYSSVLVGHYCSTPCLTLLFFHSLFNTLFFCPSWMLLLLCLCSTLLLLHSLPNTTAPLPLACPWHSLLLSQVPFYYAIMLLFFYSLLFAPCSTLLLLFILFQISISPLPSCFYKCGRSYPNSSSSCHT